MPTALPAATDYTGASVTQGGKKTFMTAVRTFLAELLGTDGAKATALATLGLEASGAIRNLTLAASVGSSALTMALKTRAGADPSATDAATVAMRSSTASAGTFTERQLTAATALTVPSGATLGHASGIAGWLYWYLIDNAGALELAVSSTFLGEAGICSTTAIGAGSTSATAIYSASSRSNVAFRLIARTRDTQTTAGTWAAVPSLVELWPFPAANSTGARGQCVLGLVSTNLVLSPYKGIVLTFPAGDAVVPSAGVSLAASGLSPDTTYFIYAVQTAGVVTSLEASATGHVTDAGTGIEVKSGDATRVLVGMARTVTGPAWADSTAKRLVRSWFNDRGIAGSGTAAGGNTTSISYVEANTAMRFEFLVWALEPTHMSYYGTHSHGANGGLVLSQLYLDAASTGAYGSHHSATGGYQGSFNAAYNATLGEGYHVLAGYLVSNGGGTATLHVGQLTAMTAGRP